MVRWWSQLVIVVLLVGCGKIAPKERARATNAPGTGGTGADVGASAGVGQAGDESNDPTAGTGGTGASGGTSAGRTNGGAGTTAPGTGGVGRGGRSGSEGGRGGGPASPYEPTNMNVPAQGDGTLMGGSFEGRYGDGWDACGSKHAGFNPAPTVGSASDGMGFLEFDSSLPCAGCETNSSDMQVLLWFPSPIPAGSHQYLYFDVVDFGPKRPTGTLLFGSPSTPTMNPCIVGEVLASIPLEELAITGEWQTRCVELTPQAAFSNFGLYVADGTFDIGLDALRFGPPCR